MWEYEQDFLVALGLLFVLEGLIPALAPQLWQSLMRQIVQMNTNSIRLAGWVSLSLGALILIGRRWT